MHARSMYNPILTDLTTEWNAPMNICTVLKRALRFGFRAERNHAGTFHDTRDFVVNVQRNRTLAYFFGEIATRRFWNAFANLGIDTSEDGPDIKIDLTKFTNDLPAFTQSLVEALEILINERENVSRDAWRSNKFPESRRQSFLDSRYSEVHAALLDLSRRFTCVWIQGEVNYGIRVAHRNHSSGVSLLTSHGTERLAVRRRR